MVDEGIVDGGSPTLAQATMGESARAEGYRAYYGIPPIEGQMVNGRIDHDGGTDDFSHVRGIDPTHTYTLLEFQRRAFLKPDNQGDLSRLIRTTDTTTHERGYLYTNPETGSAVYFTDVRQAFHAMGILLETSWNNTEIESYIDKVTDESSPIRDIFSNLVGDAYECIPFEVGFAIYKLHEKLDVQGRQQLQEIMLPAGVTGSKLIALIDDPAHLPILSELMERQDEQILRCMSGMIEICGNIDDFKYTNTHSEVDTEAIQTILYNQLRGLLSATLETADDPNFSWKLPTDTLKAMQEIMYEYSGLDYPNVIKMLETVEFGVMERNYLNHPTIHRVIEAYLNIRSMIKFYEDTSDDMKEQSHIFYPTMGRALYEHRNDSTGDKTMQLMLVKTAVSLLMAKGLLKKGYSALDAGSGPMEFLKAFEMELDADYTPKHVLAVDREEYEVPKELADHVSFERADLTSDSYRMAHRGEFDLVIQMWSPINDNKFVDQKEFLDSLNHKLVDQGIALIEIPAGYDQEMRDEMERSHRKTRGRIQKSFKADEAEITKPFEITTLMPLIHRLKQSGFRALNYGDQAEISVPLVYVTASGQERAFLIVQKVSEPVESVDQMLLHRQVLIGEFDARQHA